MRPFAIVFACLVLTAGCAPDYPKTPCLPDRPEAAPTAANEPKGPITLYFDASGSMGGYLRGHTADIRPLDDLIATVPGSTSEQATTVKLKAFGLQIMDVPTAQYHLLADISFYSCAGKPKPCNSNESHLDAVLRAIADSPPDELSVIVSDMWLSNTKMIGSPAVALGQPIDKLFSQGRSMVLIGARAPYSGVITDMPSNQNYLGARERPLYVLIVGPAHRAVAFKESLERLQSASYAPDRIHSSVFSATPVMLGGPAKLTLDPGSTALRKTSALSTRYLIPGEQFALDRGKARRAKTVSASVELDLARAAAPDVVWRGAFAQKTTIWRLSDPKKLKRCRGAWIKVRDVEGAWKVNVDAARFTLNGADPAFRSLPSGKTYLVVGSLERVALDRPNPATEWMRERGWSFTSATEASVRARQPVMFPTLNLSVLAALMEAGVDRATQPGARSAATVTAVVKME